VTTVQGEEAYNPSRLDGRGFVVLGAGGGGMGTQTSLALARAGATLLCVDNKESEAADIAAATGGTAHTADVTSRTDMEAVFARADQLFGDKFAGIVDIVGVARNSALPDAADDAIAWQFDIVLRHALLAVQIGAPMLARRGGGAITFVGSISGSSAIPTQGIYGIAKAALHQLVHYAAQEFGPGNVRVNAVAPGFVQTPRLKAVLPADVWQKIGDANPLRRPADPIDIAKAILFLSSDMASYVTSNVLTLDGGVSHNTTLPGLL
jgi:NAD(P)-dependent dehydrogenase (short-subunit alcohol dehydrogenase family)